MQTIQVATQVNAELLGWEKQLGSIEVGKLADLVAVDGNPLKDISCIRSSLFFKKDKW